MKKIHKIFLILIFLEVILLSIVGVFFGTVYWPNPCTLLSFFHPFGSEMGPEEICAQILYPTLNPLVYFIWYLIYSTIIIYFVSFVSLFIIQKKKK